MTERLAMAVQFLHPACPTCGLPIGQPEQARKPNGGMYEVACPCGWTGWARFWRQQLTAIEEMLQSI